VVVARQFRPLRRVELGEKGHSGDGRRKRQTRLGEKGEEVVNGRSGRGAGAGRERGAPGSVLERRNGWERE
jgi:hypothetical protein